jgi:hypothetical protein
VERPAIGHIVAGHRGDDHVFEFHPHDRFGHTLRFVLLEGEGFGCGHRAKPAGAGATVAGDHERGRALTPTFPAVRTLRAFADGVQTEVGDQRLGREKDRVGRQANFDPVRLLGQVEGGVDFDARHWW